MRCFSSISDFDSASSAHFRPESLQRFINIIQIELFVFMQRVIRANWSKWYNSRNLIGHIFMMQMFSNQVRVLIRLLEPISVPNHPRYSFILFKLNSICTHAKSVLGPIGVSGIFT